MPLRCSPFNEFFFPWIFLDLRWHFCVSLLSQNTKGHRYAHFIFHANRHVPNTDLSKRQCSIHLKATEVDACTYFCFCKFSLEHRPALEHQYIPTRCVSAAPSTFACTYKSYAVFSQKLVLEQYFLLAP